MTPQQVKKLQEVYDEAIGKLRDLQAEKQQIIKTYIKDLEEQKIKALRESLDLSAKSQ